MLLSHEHKNMKIFSFLLFLFFLLKPFYFFSSGIPQLSDVSLAFIFLLIFLSKDLSFDRRFSGFIFSAALFVFYVFLVNGIWSALLGISFMRPSIYYLYNLMALFLMLYLYRKLGLKLFQVVYYCVTTSVILQFLLYLLLGGGSYRTILFFNNPNQLGYYGILCLAIIIVVSEKIKVNSFWFILSVIASLILIAASLSKAAIISIVIMILSVLIFLRRNTKNKWIMNAMLLFISIVFILFPNVFEQFNDTSLVSNVNDRINNIGEASDDSAAGRGYDRLFRYPEYLIFGAGEGAYYRFESQVGVSEIHSHLGTLLFCYGIVGFFLFMLIIVQSIWKQHFSIIFPLTGAFLYGLTHNGLRHTFLWMLIGLIFASKFPIRHEENSDESK